MTCSQIRKIVSRYVDHDLSSDEKRLFELHIRDCAGCRKELEEIQAVHALFVSAKRYEAPQGFAARVMANLEERKPSGFWGFLAFHRSLVRAVEVAFALIVVMIGIISGNVLVADRTSQLQVVQATVQESFSLDLFQATPPGSVGGAYVRLMRAGDER